MPVEIEIVGLVALGVSCVGIVAFVQLRKFKSKVNNAFENVYAAVQQKPRERTIRDIPLNNIPLTKTTTTKQEVVVETQAEQEPEQETMQLDRDIVMQIFKENQEYSKKMDQNLEVLRKQLNV